MKRQSLNHLRLLVILALRALVPVLPAAARQACHPPAQDTHTIPHNPLVASHTLTMHLELKPTKRRLNASTLSTEYQIASQPATTTSLWLKKVARYQVS